MQFLKNCTSIANELFPFRGVVVPEILFCLLIAMIQCTCVNVFFGPRQLPAEVKCPGVGRPQEHLEYWATYY